MIKSVFIDFAIIICFCLVILFLFGMSCSPKKNLAAKQELRSTVKLLIDTDEAMESLVFTKFGGFSDEDIVPFSDMREIAFSEPINDVYQLLLKNEERFFSSQMWLKGEDITVKAIFKNNEIQIDTVINSPFYYYTKNTLQYLNDSSIVVEEKNVFLIDEIENMIDSPFSDNLVSKYIELNIDKPNNLRTLKNLLLSQNDKYKDKFKTSKEELRKLLDVDSFEIANYQFKNESGIDSKITLKEGAIHVIDYWFTGCPPCIEDHKVIQADYDSFSNAGIEIIGISTDYDHTKWMNFLRKRNYQWGNLVEFTDTIAPLSDDLAVRAYPTYLVVDGNGKLLNRTNSLKDCITFLRDSKILK